LQDLAGVALAATDTDPLFLGEEDRQEAALLALPEPARLDLLAVPWSGWKPQTRSRTKAANSVVVSAWFESRSRPVFWRSS